VNYGVRFMISEVAASRESLVFKIATPGQSCGLEAIDKVWCCNDGASAAGAALYRPAHESDVVGLTGVDQGQILVADCIVVRETRQVRGRSGSGAGRRILSTDVIDSFILHQDDDDMIKICSSGCCTRNLDSVRLSRGIFGSV